MASSKVNNAGNSHVENAPNAYEMSGSASDQHTYSTVSDQPEASAPAASMKPVVTNAAKNSRAQPSEPPGRTSANDSTLVDNDLYG